LARWPNARLWMVGEGPLRRKLLEQIEERHLVGRVVLAGVFDDIEDMLRAADLFVLPSLDEDLSLALLEAMAQGLPVVTTDLPGNRAVITDGVQGRLAPAGDAAALAVAVQEVLDQPDFASRLGEQGQQRVAADFSLDQMVERHLQVFNEVLGNRQAEVGIQNEVQARAP
jgi:glycosyltransferase involved in cell wall biosynthesis